MTAAKTTVEIGPLLAAVIVVCVFFCALAYRSTFKDEDE